MSQLNTTKEQVALSRQESWPMHTQDADCIRSSDQIVSSDDQSWTDNLNSTEGPQGLAIRKRKFRQAFLRDETVIDEPKEQNKVEKGYVCKQEGCGRIFKRKIRLA